MSLVRAYHAGYASEIQPFLDGAVGISESQSPTNWLGRGVYFWESDHRRAEKWAIRNVREMILECHLETELLIDLLIDDQRSQAFWKLAEKHVAAVHSSSCPPNDISKEYFGLDGELINRLRPSLEKHYAGMRMALLPRRAGSARRPSVSTPADSDLPVELPGDSKPKKVHRQLLSRLMSHCSMTEFIACHSMCPMNHLHHPPLEILAELRAIEQEILQGIEELEGMLR